MQKRLLLSSVLLAVSITLLMTCALPIDPIKNPESLNIECFLTNKQLTVLKNDSVQIGVIVNIPNLVKNLQVEHGDINRIETLFLTNPGSTTFDTTYFKTMYSTVGNKTITIKVLRSDNVTKEFTMPLIVTAPEMSIVFDSVPSIKDIVFVGKVTSFQIVSHTVPSTLIHYTVKSNPPLDERQLSIRENTNGEISLQVDSAGIYALNIVASNDVVSDSVVVKVQAVASPKLTQGSTVTSLKPGLSDTLTFTGLISETLVLSDTSGFKPGEITVLNSGSNNVLKVLFKPEESKTYSFPIKVSGSTAEGTIYSGIYTVEQIVIGDKPQTDTTGPAIVLKSPESNRKTIATSTIAVSVICTDKSGLDSVIYSVRTVSGVMKREYDTVYTAVITGLLPGENQITIAATDKSPRKNRSEKTLIINYDRTLTDSTGPLITLKSPTVDSAKVSSGSLSMEISCSDASGVDTVICKLGSTLLPVSKGPGDNYSIAVSGLIKGANTISITAIDKAALPKSTIRLFTITYDPTMTDNIPPTVVLKNPQYQDQRIFTDTITVRIECSDDNGIFSATATRAGKALEVIESGSLYSVKLAGLTKGKCDTVQFTITDKSNAKNKKEYVVILRYNLKPSAVSLTTPADDTNSVITKPAFSWTGGDDPDGDSVLYTLRYGKSENGLDKVISGITGKKTTLTSGLEAYTRYYWQVIAITPVNGDSVLSEIRTFTTIENIPSITVEPAGQKVALGSKGTFSVNAAGVNLKYQWYKGDSLITGATAANYTTPSVTGSYNGSVYKCMVANVAGKVTSADAVLTVVYSVTYDVNGGTGSVPTDTNAYAKDESVIIKAGTGLTRTNYVFGGWGVNPTSNTKVYAANEALKMSDGNLTLYAVWNQLYNITYNANSPGTGTVPEGGKYAQGSEVVIAGNTGALVKTGYEFAGWNTTKSGTGTNYITGQKIVMGSADLVLYAKWAPTFGVTYNANGGGSAGGHGSGVVPVDTRMYITDSMVGVLANPGILTRTGYVFGGWSQVQNGPAVSSFRMGSINVTLYARWLIKDFDGNEYSEITLAGRVWMVQNLRVTKLKDGTVISRLTSAQKSSAYYAGNVVRGHAYNGYALFTGKLAPEGWHIADQTDWDTLNSLYNDNAKAIASKDGWASCPDNNTIGYNNGLTNNTTGLTLVPDSTGERSEYWIGNSIVEIDFENVIGALYFMTYDSQYLSNVTRIGAVEYHFVRCVRDY